MPAVISIQSAVAYGHVGNSAAIFPLQRLGIDAWPVNTVLLSNHPGHGACRGHSEPPEAVREILAGIEDRGVFDQIDGVITGYLSDPKLGPLVLDAVSKIKAIDPSRVYACDPVMGDHGDFFVAPGLPEFFRDQALALADILTPNMFELGYLSGHVATNLTSALLAARQLVERGPEMVLVTSVETPEYPRQIGMLLVMREKAWSVFTPKLAVRLNGTGDCLAALTLGLHLQGKAPDAMLAHVASSMFGLVQETFKANSRELLLVQAQGEIIQPSQMFKAIPL